MDDYLGGANNEEEVIEIINQKLCSRCTRQKTHYVNK